MSANYRDLLKYAATGQASPSMTYYDRMRASALMGGGGKTQTLTGVPPLTFNADGSPITILSMKGNGQHTGTPTLDAPIMPEFCGEKTGNLARYWKAAYVTASGDVSVNRVNGMSFPVKIESGQTVCFTNPKTNFGRGIAVFSGFNGEALTDMIYRSTNSTVTYTADSDCYVIIWGNYDNTTSMDESVFALCGQMLNSGSTALPYEPYGYKIPFTNTGQTTNVYLGQISTVRRIVCHVFDGTETGLYKNDQDANNYLYYVQLFASGWNLAKIGTQCVCSHLPLLSDTPISSIGIRLRQDTGRILYLNFGADIMSAQTSGNTAAGLKEYLATQYAAGTPVTVWYVFAEPKTAIVNEPLAKIGDYADELNNTVATLPEIPTTTGQNTLTVDTTLAPSSLTIKGHIKE